MNSANYIDLTRAGRRKSSRLAGRIRSMCCLDRDASAGSPDLMETSSGSSRFCCKNCKMPHYTICKCTLEASVPPNKRRKMTTKAEIIHQTKIEELIFSHLRPKKFSNEDEMVSSTTQKKKSTIIKLRRTSKKSSNTDQQTPPQFYRSASLDKLYATGDDSHIQPLQVFEDDYAATSTLLLFNHPL